MELPLGSGGTTRAIDKTWWAERAGISMVMILVAALAQATPVTVPNPSFENPDAMGGPDGGQATAWTANGGAGTGGVSHFAHGFTTAAHGAQYHWLNLPSFGGPNPSVTQSNVGLIGNAQAGTYILTVAVGRRNNDATTDGTVVIELLAGGSVIGSQTVIDPFHTYAADTWHDVTAVATVHSDDAAVGQDLTIRLSAFDGTGGIRSQGQFDNVRLDFARPVCTSIASGPWGDVAIWNCEDIPDATYYVRIGPNHTVILDANRDAGALEFMPGSSLSNPGAQQLTVKADWINNSGPTAFAAGQGVVRFDGNENGVVSGAYSTRFYDVLVDKPAGKTLLIEQTVTIERDLKLAAGMLGQYAHSGTVIVGRDIINLAYAGAMQPGPTATTFMGSSGLPQVHAAITGFPAAFNNLVIANPSVNAEVAIVSRLMTSIHATASLIINRIGGLQIAGLGASEFHDVVIDVGGVMETMPGNAITVTGQWENNGAFEASGGAASFIGTGPQTIGGSGSTVFNSLTINNGSPGGVTLQIDATVNGHLDLLTSLTPIPGADLTLGPSATIKGAIVALFINDVSVVEGNAGQTDVVFTLSLSAPAPTGGVTVAYQSADETAQVANNDYAEVAGTATIPEGSSSGSITIHVNGDEAREDTETFVVNLSNTTNATILDSQGQGTITNDDGTVDVTPVRPWGLALEGGRPNPSAGEAQVWFTLPSDERAVLEILDVTGRCVLLREVGALGAGHHGVNVSGATKSPGIYFLKLTQGEHVVHSRMVVVR